MNRLALKFLTSANKGNYSGFEWPVPNGKPGGWVRAKGKLRACENGIHACTLEQAPRWLAPNAYLIELDGRVVDSGDKLVARKGRLLRQLQWEPRLFAADCAEHVLHIFEEKYPKDDRPRKAIEAARRGNKAAHAAYAAADAADDAADAANAAASAAASAAADAAYAADAADAADAANAAADAANAADAAAHAAYAAADAANAANAAAADAANAAAYAANAAHAAYAAADAAAHAADAAHAAERKWQYGVLAKHLGLTKEEREAVQ